MDGVVRLQDWRSAPAQRGSEALENEPGKVSQAQAAAQGAGVGSQARVPRRRHIFRSSEWTRLDANKIHCKVTLISAGGESAGEAEGPDVPGLRAEIAAQATLRALDHAEGEEVSLALKGARVLRFMDSPIVAVGVYGVNGGEMLPLLGACLVRSSVEHAAILATLQAVDRWLGWRARRAALREARR